MGQEEREIEPHRCRRYSSIYLRSFTVLDFASFLNIHIRLLRPPLSLSFTSLLCFSASLTCPKVSKKYIQLIDFSFTVFSPPLSRNLAFVPPWYLPPIFPTRELYLSLKFYKPSFGISDHLPRKKADRDVFRS